ncbi:MAG: DUF4367 domain-containing protein [Lachnospiraceae bacterium]|nr:DUF4367 domain-containing protein [Lachnospiraceae bacterium]
MAKDKRNKERLRQYWEEEAEDLERRAMEYGGEQPGVEEFELDPEESFRQLMENIAEREKSGTGMGGSSVFPGKRVGRGRRVSWRAAVVLAAVLVLTFAFGMGITGQKVYTPEAVVEHRDGEVIIKINNEKRIERDVEEEEIYQEIEERIGIFSLRFGYKPQGMELYKVEILEDVGEAKIQYLYKEQILNIYISRDFSESEITIKADGSENTIENVEIFNLRKFVNIQETEHKNGEEAYFTKIIEDNISYFVEGTVNKEEFLKIISEIYNKNA